MRASVLQRTETITPASEQALGHMEWGALAVSVLWIVVLQCTDWPPVSGAFLLSGSNVDSAVFALMGHYIREGAIPYVHYWDHKPPFIHLINAAALSLTGDAWGIWVISLITLLAAAALGYHVLRQAFGALSAILGLTFFAFCLSNVLASNKTEEYALPLAWAAVLLLVRWRSIEERAYSRGFLLGLLSALQLFLRPNLTGAVSSVGLVLTIVLFSKGQFRIWLQFVAGALSGAALISAGFFAYLGIQGALPAFWDQVFHYNILYSSSTLKLQLRAAYNGLTLFSFFLLLPVAGWLIGVSRLARVSRRDPFYPLLLLGVVWAPIELVLASMSGRGFYYYFMPLVPALSFLVGLFAWQLVSHDLLPAYGILWKRARRSILALAAAIALVTMAHTAVKARDWGLKPRLAQVPVTVEYIRQRTQTGDSIFVWGHAADVYVLSGRKPASRFVQALPLLTPRYADQSLIDGFMDELRAAAPLIILDATNRAENSRAGEDLVPPLGTWDANWRYPDPRTPHGSLMRGVTWWVMPPALKRFYDFVSQHYYVADRIGPQGWVVYRRLPAASPRSAHADYEHAPALPENSAP